MRNGFIEKIKKKEESAQEGKLNKPYVKRQRKSKQKRNIIIERTYK